MRIILDETSNSQLTAAVELLRMAGIHVAGGGMIADSAGQHATILLDNESAGRKAIEVLARSGIVARLE